MSLLQIKQFYIIYNWKYTNFSFREQNCLTREHQIHNEIRFTFSLLFIFLIIVSILIILATRPLSPSCTPICFSVALWKILVFLKRKQHPLQQLSVARVIKEVFSCKLFWILFCFFSFVHIFEWIRYNL